MTDVFTEQVLQTVQQLLEVAKRIRGRHADVRLNPVEQFASAGVLKEDVLDVVLLTVAVAFDHVLVVQALVNLNLAKRSARLEAGFLVRSSFFRFVFFSSDAHLFQNGIKMVLVLVHVDYFGGNRVHRLFVDQQVNPIRRERPVSVKRYFERAHTSQNIALKQSNLLSESSFA